ncbi:MAG: polyphenol oxidase family protein [Acidobacteria bacterium]|nr:polyphenol oxidase family protein [Acidobacteriota bacterium]
MQSPCGPVLKCRPLEWVADHVFTTRELQLSSADEWRRVGDFLGVAAVVTSNQVHGRDVATSRRGLPRALVRQDADVLVSDDPDVAIAVRAADCVPLLVADSSTGAVAAVHAGWRGTAAGAAAAGVQALRRAFGAKPEHLVAAIGPSIGPCCYEVGSDLVDAFAAAGYARHVIQRWFASRPPRRDAARRGLQPQARTSLRLDVAGANRDQLMLEGVPEGKIYACGLCAAMHLDVLTSYRAEKEKAGRLAAVIRARADSRQTPPAI